MSSYAHDKPPMPPPMTMTRFRFPGSFADESAPLIKSAPVVFRAWRRVMREWEGEGLVSMAVVFPHNGAAPALSSRHSRLPEPCHFPGDCGTSFPSVSHSRL